MKEGTFEEVLRWVLEQDWCIHVQFSIPGKCEIVFNLPEGAAESYGNEYWQGENEFDAMTKAAKASLKAIAREKKILQYDPHR